MGDSCGALVLIVWLFWVLVGFYKQGRLSKKVRRQECASRVYIIDLLAIQVGPIFFTG